MTKKFVFLLFFIIFFTGCSKSEPVIVQQKVNENTSSKKRELIVQEVEDNIEEFIEFKQKDEIVAINIQAIPVLQHYLQAVLDRDQAINDMNLIPIENIPIYLLEFSCLNNRCSYLLLDFDRNHEAYLITDLAKLSQHQISPDQKHVFFEFKRDTIHSIPFSHIVVFNVIKWKEVSLQSENSAITLNYTTPLSFIGWLDNSTISALKPTINKLTDEYIIKWRQLGNPTTEIKFIIE